ncbi:MAG: tRNA (adenosine(37)-N6)-threonylcarbamoyltransferase complex transferase subunit TsaD [Myxococcota bacterium]
MKVLGIESSCDETAAAVVDGGLGDRPHLRSNIVSSQVDTHRRFGGVVPEVASREHVARIAEVAARSIEASGGGEIDAVAVTRGPGLVGALLVGMQFAKGFALARGLPWIGVNHLEGHLSAALLSEAPPPYPHVALIASGGHTQTYWVEAFGRYQVIGGTRDDAAGEAFDKVAKMLGLGYPGGVEIDRLAKDGNPHAVHLPRAMDSRKNDDFSFSGLKTAAAAELAKRRPLKGADLADFCASLQEAICDILTKKAVRAARKRGARGVVLAGGVAANSRLRELLVERCAAKNLEAFLPSRALCTDNAALIAAGGWLRLVRGERRDWSTSVRARLPLDVE